MWSDHGYQHGEKDSWEKYTLWEKATRIPLIVVAPDVATVSGTCQRLVSLLDLYPTLIDLCGLKCDGPLDGVSLVPLLCDPKASWNRPALMTFQRGNHAVRSERYRYIRYASGEEELYDHAVDPHEWTNLADLDEHAEVKQRHANWLPRHDANAVENFSKPKKSPASSGQVKTNDIETPVDNISCS